MKLGIPWQFSMLETIGPEAHLQIAPKLLFLALVNWSQILLRKTFFVSIEN